MEQLEGSNVPNNLSGFEDDYDDYDYAYRKRRETGEDEDDMDDAEFCSTVLKPRSRHIIGGISLRELCEGKEFTFEMKGGSLEYEEDDEEYYYKQEDGVDDDDEEEEEEETGVKRRNKKQPIFLNESFKSLISKMSNVTDDGCVKKQVIVDGIGKIVPEGSFVVIHYNLFKETSEEPFDSTYLRNRVERINLGQNNLIPGMEIALKTMKKKENSRFFIEWTYAFGALGCPDRIEPKCNIIADITLLDFKEIDVSGLVKDCASWFERGIMQVKVEQAAANDSFENGKIRQAIGRYKSSIRIINNLGFANDNDERIALDLKVKSLVNMAICYNKLGQHELACVMCQEALSITPGNLKAQFHYARASIALSNFIKARTLLLNLNKKVPNNQEVIDELRKLDQKKQLYTMTTRSFWERAFMKLSETEEPKANAQGSNSPGESSKDDGKGETKGENKNMEEISKKLKLSANLNDDEEADDCEDWE